MARRFQLFSGQLGVKMLKNSADRLGEELAAFGSEMVNFKILRENGRHLAVIIYLENVHSDAFWSKQVK